MVSREDAAEDSDATMVVVGTSALILVMFSGLSVWVAQSASPAELAGDEPVRRGETVYATPGTEPYALALLRPPFEASVESFAPSAREAGAPGAQAILTLQLDDGRRLRIERIPLDRRCTGGPDVRDAFASGSRHTFPGALRRATECRPVAPLP